VRVYQFRHAGSFRKAKYTAEAGRLKVFRAPFSGCLLFLTLFKTGAQRFGIHADETESRGSFFMMMKKKRTNA
jgi:hypothetical protein